MSVARALRWASLGLCALGLIAGSTVQDDAPRPVEERAGYRVLQADLHAHTRFSDGVVGPCDLVRLGRRRGLDVVGVTEHNSVFPSLLARACAKLVHDAPIVVTGEEVTTWQVHLLALGIEADVDARAAPKAIVASVHAQGGVVIAAHPTRRFRPAVEAICADIDGLEVVHPIAYGGPSALGSWDEIVDLSRGPCGVGKAMLGNSDYHAGSILGLLRTQVFVVDASAEGVVEAIRAGRTVTFAPDGTPFGPPDLVAALEREPLSARPTDYGYRGSGLFDRVMRGLSFVGLCGLLVFGWRRQE